MFQKKVEDLITKLSFYPSNSFREHFLSNMHQIVPLCVHVLALQIRLILRYLSEVIKPCISFVMDQTCINLYYITNQVCLYFIQDNA